jgi:histidine triad (HIT) family protein
MASIFTKIINGEIPCYKIAETEHCIAFLDVNPLVKGHTLVIPKKEIDYYFDLSDDVLLEVNTLAKQVAKAIEKVIPCKRIGVAVIGLEVPHAHMHLVPLNTIGNINFKSARVNLTPEEFAKIAESIRENL